MERGGTLSKLGASAEQALDELREAYSRGNLVVFAGAALSTAAGLPSWASIVSTLASLPGMSQAPARRVEMLELLQSGKLVDALSVASQVLGRPEFTLIIERMLNDQSLPVPPLAHAIAALSPRLKAVLTTNLDHTLEHAFAGRWPALWTASPGLLQRRGFILKLHGTLLDRSSWVFTREDYDQATWGHGRSRETLGQFFQSFPLLFAGHDLESEDLTDVLSRVRALAGDHPPRNFALVPAGTIQGQRRLNLERAGIHLIEYANPDGQHTQASQFLAAIAGTAETDIPAVPQSAPGLASPPAVAPSEESPFPGLEYFDEDKAHHFFGRETEISAALQMMGNTPQGHVRWLQVEGASGTGKSSFARAGLLPKVRLGWVDGTPQRWSVAVLRPGRQPLLSLAQAVFTALRPQGASLDEFARQLRTSDTALTSFVRQHAPAGHGFLLLVDQFEELFTLAEPDSAQSFEQCLATALSDTSVPFYLITTIRGDFLEHLRSLARLSPLLQEGASRYSLAPMGPVGFRAAITQPAEHSGLHWEPGLPERLLEDVSGIESGLPLLAHALRVLWTERSGKLLTHERYDSLGGTLGALTRSADQLLESLGAEGKQRARRLLLALVTSQRGKVSRRPLMRAEALQAAGGDTLAERVLTCLSGGRGPTEPDTAPAPVRLIVVTQSEGQDRVDLIHEALLLRWATFSRWIEEERQALDRREDLESAARTWQRAGSHGDDLPMGGKLAYLREASPITHLARQYLLKAAEREHERSQRERRRKRALVAIAAASFLGLVAVSVLASYAFDQRSLAQQRLSEALTVADQVVFTIDRKLEPLSGTAEVRKELLESSSKLLETLRAGAQDDADVLRSRLGAHHQRGDLALSHDNLEQARREYEAGLEIARRLEALAPDSSIARHDLSVSLNKLGDVAQQQGRLDEARSFFHQSLDLRQSLAKADPSNASLQRDLSVSLNKLGAVAQQQGRLDEARSFFQQSLDLTQSLAKADPSNASLQRDLCVSLNKLGAVAEQQGRLDEARSFFQQDLDLTQSLAKADPSNASLQRDLSVSLNKLGDVAQQQGRLDEARSFFQQSLDLTQSLAKADPSDAQLRLDWVTSELRLAMLALLTKDPPASRIHRANAERLLGDSQQLKDHPRYQALSDFLSKLPR
jgi:tetratricopeptide (TPR) repeat protein